MRACGSGYSWRRISALLISAGLLASPALAQTPADDSPSVVYLQEVTKVGTEVRRPPWLYPLASAVVPGAGQLLAGKDRAALYMVAELFFLTRYVSLRGEGRQQRDQYRDLAFSVARAPFAPARRDTTFEYFEELGKFVESGPFDTDPGEALVPPTDERTFNGSIWLLAREAFFPDPTSPPDTSSAEYRRALDFYRERAVGPNFQWSWRDAGLEQDLYRQSIRRSDDAFRTATQYLGLILANHVLSTIDAFVTTRMSRSMDGLMVHSGVWRSRGEALVGGLLVTVSF